ncbi:MAG TPA: GyrI-like domain-containing protein [Pseudonocardiaceae bacterium]
MSVTPALVPREAEPYVAATGTVTAETFPRIADRMPVIIGWLAEHGLAPAGAPFFRYRVIDGERLTVDAAVPVAVAAAGGVLDGLPRGPVADGFFVDALPAGRYATVRRVGHPDQLFAVADAADRWAAAAGITWDRTEGDDGVHWGARIERFHSNPMEEPDPSRWDCELAILTA